MISSQRSPSPLTASRLHTRRRVPLPPHGNGDRLRRWSSTEGSRHQRQPLSGKHRLSRRRALDVADLADEPLLLLHRSFGSREWFDAACSIAHIRPRVLLESAAPHTLVALTGVGYGVAVVPSTVLVPSGVRALPLIQRGASIGRWLTIAWDPQRLLAAYAEQFVEELVAFCKRAYPGRDLIRRAPPLPQPKSQ